MAEKLTLPSFSTPEDRRQEIAQEVKLAIREDKAIIKALAKQDLNRQARKLLSTADTERKARTVAISANGEQVVLPERETRGKTFGAIARAAR